MPMLKVGDPAPEFAIPNQNGVTMALQQFRGKNVLFWWYPKADTPG